MFDFRLGSDHSLVLPVVGDAEIRRIEFEFPNVRLHIVQPVDGTKIDLLLVDMRFLFVHTDHPQNVIERIFIYKSWEQARLPPEVDLHVVKKEFGLDGRYIVVVESVVGGPLVCGACDFSVQVG